MAGVRSGAQAADDRERVRRAEARRDLSARLSKAMNVQGVAALVTPPNGPEGTFWLVMLSAGASEPDVIELELNSPAAAVRALDASSVSTTLLRRTLGLTFVDVLHRRGPVIVDVAGSASVSRARPRRAPQARAQRLRQASSPAMR